MANANLCLNRKTNRCMKFNDEGQYQIKDMNVINFALSIIIVASLLFIFVSQVSFEMSPGFKLFLNEIYYPILMIALPFAAINVGFNMWTSQDLTFAQMWKLAMRRSFFSYYFYAIIIATIGIITIAVLQSTTDYLPHNWNPAWSATYFFSCFVPLQNFSGTGTIFTISMFWFTLCFPFIVKFFNKLNQWQASLWVGFLITWCCFIGIWNDVFESYDDLVAKIPYWREVTKYVQFIVIFNFLFMGMYIRRFMKNMDWKIVLIGWISFVLVVIGVETFLNVWFHKYTTLIAKNIGGPISCIATLLAFLTLSNIGFKQEHHQRKWFIRLDKFNRFMNMIVGDIFTVILVFNHYFDGYLIAHILLNLDVHTVTQYYWFYPQSRVVVESYNPDLGWIFIGFSAACSWMFICIGLVRVKTYQHLDKWIENFKHRVMKR